MTVRWLEERADSKWTRCANALRERPGVEAVLDVTSANPYTDAERITRGDLAAFRPRRHFRARVVKGEILAVYAPPPRGDDAPSSPC